MIRLTEEVEASIIRLAEDRGVYIEGNLLKLIEPITDEFAEYIENAKADDLETRQKRLEMTKQVQQQNRLLEKKASENQSLMTELQEALAQAEQAKQEAVNDLDLMQKRTQFELIGNIVQVALWIIMGVGIITTILYALALFTGSVDTTLLGNTWSNLFGILLTNSFSIIGTIMGVKYATEKSNTKSE